MVRAVKRPILHQRTKFRKDRSNRYGDIAIFVIFKMAAAAILITERRVLELIPVLGSQPAGDVSHKPSGRLPLLSTRPAVTPATLKRLLPVLLLGEQRHNGCEQLA